MSSLNKKLLIVHKLPDESCSYTNLFYHNPEDLPSSVTEEVYLAMEIPSDDTSINRKRKMVVYQSIPSKVIPKGSIGVGRIVRSQFNLKIGQEYEFIVTPVARRFAQSFRLKLNLRKTASEKQVGEASNSESSSKEDTSPKKRDYYSVHEEEFNSFFKKEVKTYLNAGQHLVLKYHDQDLIVKVVTGAGFLTEYTKLELTTDDLMVNIVNENQISREFFRDDFSFESIGIGGLDNELAGILRRAMSTRAVSPELVSRFGIKHVKGLILYGPPGTGKTLIARNLGKLLSKVPPQVINGPELLNKYVGQSEENLRNLFKDAKSSHEKEKDKSPLYVFIFDEIDAICKQRSSGKSVGDSMVNQLLTLIDGVNQLPNIFIIGMTNRLDLIDEALIRPGRLELKVRIHLPDEKGREQIFRIHTNIMKQNNLVDSLNLPMLVERTKNFSGAEIEAVVVNATSHAFGEHLRQEDSHEKDIVIKEHHFDKAIDEIVPAFGNKTTIVFKNLPSLNEANLKIYNDLWSGLQGEGMFSFFLQLGNKMGKTLIMKHLCLAMGKIGYTKMIQPIDLIKKSEHEKLEYLTGIMDSAYESKKSLVIIDDIDIMLDWVNINNQYSFSIRLYQVVKTILKTIPDHTLYFICTSSNQEIFTTIGSDFNTFVGN